MTPSPSSSTQSGELAPCPFCGGTDFRTETEDVQPDNYWSGFVQCTTCDACGPEPDEWLGSAGEAEQAASEFWNRRAAASAHTIGEDAANGAMGEREAFEWPPMPDLPNQGFYAFDQALFTAHQMQGYANAYGEVVRAALTAPQPSQPAQSGEGTES